MLEENENQNIDLKIKKKVKAFKSQILKRENQKKSSHPFPCYGNVMIKRKIENINTRSFKTLAQKVRKIRKSNFYIVKKLLKVKPTQKIKTISKNLLIDLITQSDLKL